MSEKIYSPISWVLLKNFRNLEEVRLDFTQSPIISLVGDNEAGKTSVVKGIGVISKHAYAKSHKDFVRDDTQGFGIAMGFEDGKQVVRMRTNMFNKYQIKGADGKTIWETNKIDSGLPTQVQEIMGIVEEEETKQLLQIRTYEDLLLFVVTPSSTNYKVMYNALKVEQITSAIKAGSQEANRYKNGLQSTEISIRTLEDSIGKIIFIDISPLTLIRERLANQRGNMSRLNSIGICKENISQAQSQLGALALLQEHQINPVSLSVANRVNNAMKLLEELKRKKAAALNIQDAVGLSKIELETASKLAKAAELKINNAGIRERQQVLAQITDVPAIDLSVIARMSRVSELAKSVRSDKAKLSAIKLEELLELPTNIVGILSKLEYVKTAKAQVTEWKETKQKYDEYVEGTTNYLKSIGAKVVSCPKCGEGIVVDTTA